MRFLDKMERKCGRYAIPHLTLYIIVCYVIGYLLQMMQKMTGFDMSYWIGFSPYHVCHGQVWRLVTWILVPPSSFNILTIIMLLFYYSIGTNLERTIGDFKYNVFIFGGVLFTIIGVMATWGVCNLIASDSVTRTAVNASLQMYTSTGAAVTSNSTVFINTSLFAYTSTYYLSTSIFLAYALCYPDMQVLLYFIIPLKVRWLAILDLVFMAYSFVRGGIGARVVIAAALVNLAVFFLLARNGGARITPGQVKRRQAYRKNVQQASAITKHKCAVCGRTEQDGDDLQFRFCSRCNGNYEYCQEHLFTHVHVQ